MGFVFTYVTFSWLLFQLPDISEALRYLQAIGENTADYVRFDRLLILGIYCLPVCLYHLHGLCREHRKNRLSASSIESATNSGITVSGSTSPNFSVSVFQRFNISAFLYNAAYGGMLFWILFNSGSSAEFIYFQF